MIPILYASNAINFNNNGLGMLNEAETCKCTEKLNEAYEIDLKICKDSPHAREIAPGCIVKVRSNYEDDLQLFRLYSVELNDDGSIVCKGAHISYDTSGIPILPFTASNLDEAIDNLNTNRKLLSSSDFVINADFTKEGAMEVKTPTSFRSLLGNSDATIIGVYGGEFHYDNFVISLLEKRGSIKGICFRYGKNIVKFEHETNTENLYSAVLGYWSKTNGNDQTIIYGNIVQCNGVFGYDKILILDTTNEIKNENNADATVDQIDDFVTDYIAKNYVYVPEIKMKIDYEDSDKIVQVCVGDSLGVIYPEYNINMIARCNKVVFDCLAERNESIEIGVEKKDLADTIIGISKGS